MPRRRVRNFLCAAIAAIGLLLTFASGALAVVTASQITTPSDPTLLPIAFQPPEKDPPTQTITVAGTAATDDANKADVVELGCFYATSGGAQARRVVQSLGGATVTLTVHSDGTFTTADLTGSAQASLESLQHEQPCTLRAVPQGTATNANVEAFGGPRLGESELRVSADSTPPSSPYDDFLSTTTLQGFWGWDTASACGPYGRVFAPGTFQEDTVYISDCEASLFGENDAETGSSIVVGGHFAYGTDAAHNIHKLASGEPFATLSAPVLDQSTGDLTQTESEDLVRCVAADGSAVDNPNPDEKSCVSFVPTGVRLVRTIKTGQSGLQAQVSDQFQSTDGSTHPLSLDYSEEQGDLTSTPSYRFPGESTFSELTAGSTLPQAASAPETVYFQADHLAGEPDNGLENPRGAITVAPLPDTIHAVNDEEVEFRYTNRTVPSSGSLTVVHILSQSLTQAQVEALAGAAQAQLAGPALAIGSPVSGATLKASPTTVSGTVSDASGVSSVSVNGVAATIATNGGWSASVPLSAGANTLTATATDVLGKVATQSVSVTYSPAPPPPPPTSARITRIASSKAGVSFTLTCAGSSGGTCTVHALLSTRERLRGHRLLAVSAHRRTHSKTVTVGSVRFTIPAGHTITVTLKLNATGRKLLAHFGALPTHLTVTSTPAASIPPNTILSRNLTIKRPRRHHRRRHH